MPFKLGLHITCKDRKHIFAKMFSKLSIYMAWSPYPCNEGKS